MTVFPKVRRSRIVTVVALVPLLAACQVTTRASQSSQGAQGNGRSGSPAISDDGRLVAFSSSATNLTPGDSNAVKDVFVRDRRSNTTTRVSVSSAGTQANALSGGFGDGDEIAISGNGRYVAFTSEATNLVPGDANGRSDVFVHDRQTGTTTLEGPDGRRPDLDDSGSFLAYDVGGFPDAGKVLVRDRLAGTTQLIPSGTQTASQPDLSGDGRYVAFVIDFEDAWLYDRTLQLLDRLSYTRDSVYGPQVSDDGETVVFGNGGNDNVLVFDDGRISRLPGGLSYQPDVSDDGRWVTYASESVLATTDTNRYDTDIYLVELATSEVTHLSVGSDGGANAASNDPAISGDARLVAFFSDASNLVDGDTNGVRDVFVRDRNEASTSSAE